MLIFWNDNQHSTLLSPGVTIVARRHNCFLLIHFFSIITVLCVYLDSLVVCSSNSIIHMHTKIIKWQSFNYVLMVLTWLAKHISRDSFLMSSVCLLVNLLVLRVVNGINPGQDHWIIKKLYGCELCKLVKIYFNLLFILTWLVLTHFIREAPTVMP